jgi:transcriptional regulator GlxA family with amidase domain
MTSILRERTGPREATRRRRVLVLILPDVHLQDLAGPVQVLDEASAHSAGYELLHCSTSSRVRSAQGLVMSELLPLPEPRPDDLVLVPGVAEHALDRLQCPRDWLRRATTAGATVASVCSGAFVLAAAGLLDGRRCTTHWVLVDRLRRQYPRVTVLDGLLFVADGNVVTSAGMASGIDMALALVEEHHGPRVTARVAREMVVYIRRNGDEQQQSVYLDHRTHLHPGVHRVQDFIVAHSDRKVTLGQLARIAAMSPRNLSRVFHRAAGVTPKQFATQVRIQVARDLLHDPQRSVSSIAESCGFEDARQLRRLWRRSFGLSVAAYRARAVAARPRAFEEEG